MDLKLICGLADSYWCSNPYRSSMFTCRYRCMLYAAVFPSLADSTVVCDGSAADPVAQEASPPHHTGGGARGSCFMLATLSPSSVHHSQRPVWASTHTRPVRPSTLAYGFSAAATERKQQKYDRIINSFDKDHQLIICSIYTVTTPTPTSLGDIFRVSQYWEGLHPITSRLPPNFLKL